MSVPQLLFQQLFLHFLVLLHLQNPIFFLYLISNNLPNLLISFLFLYFHLNIEPLLLNHLPPVFPFHQLWRLLFHFVLSSSSFPFGCIPRTLRRLQTAAGACFTRVPALFGVRGLFARIFLLIFHEFPLPYIDLTGGKWYAGCTNANSTVFAPQNGFFSKTCSKNRKRYH